MTPWGSALEHERTIGPSKNPRRRCSCGCNGRATHTGFANGVALVSACEFFIRRWVRDARARPVA